MSISKCARGLLKHGPKNYNITAETGGQGDHATGEPVARRRCALAGVAGRSGRRRAEFDGRDFSAAPGAGKTGPERGDVERGAAGGAIWELGTRPDEPGKYRRECLA